MPCRPVARGGYGAVARTLVLTAGITAWYPASMRTSAVGWALGVGRIGAIAGPTIGGALLATTGGNVAEITGVFAGFAVLAALAVLFIGAPKPAAGTVARSDADQSSPS